MEAEVEAEGALHCLITEVDLGRPTTTGIQTMMFLREAVHNLGRVAGRGETTATATTSTTSGLAGMPSPVWLAHFLPLSAALPTVICRGWRLGPWPCMALRRTPRGIRSH